MIDTMMCDTGGESSPLFCLNSQCVLWGSIYNNLHNRREGQYFLT